MPHYGNTTATIRRTQPTHESMRPVQQRSAAARLLRRVTLRGTMRSGSDLPGAALKLGCASSAPHSAREKWLQLRDSSR